MKPYCESLRLSDHVELGNAAAGEELQLVALEDRAAVRSLIDGVDAVVHMGGVSVEGLRSHRAGQHRRGLQPLRSCAHPRLKRIVFAGSNHVTGFYRQDEVIAPEDPMRTDGFYCISLVGQHERQAPLGMCRKTD